MLNLILPFLACTCTTVVINKQVQYFLVSAKGSVHTKPDIAIINLGLVSEGKDISKVFEDNTSKMNTIIKELKNFGIDEKDMQTTNYSLSPKYDYNMGKTTMVGYILNQELQVKVRNFQLIGRIIQRTINLGGNLINLYFDIEDIERYKAEARKIAIENAKRKAMEIAKYSGLSLGNLVNVSESFSYPIPMYAKESIAQQSVEPKIEEGQKEVAVEVTLTFEVLH